MAYILQYDSHAHAHGCTQSFSVLALSTTSDSVLQLIVWRHAYIDITGDIDMSMCRGIIAQQSPQRCGLTCQGRPASEDHEWIDAFTFANWTVDYLKYDNCQACKYGYGSTAYIMQVTRMGDALKATGKPIFYSTEMGGAAFGPDICNSARGISAQPQPHWIFTSEKTPLLP